MTNVNIKTKIMEFKGTKGKWSAVSGDILACHVDEEDYGNDTIGWGTPKQHEVPIKSYCKVLFVDDRICSTIKLENGIYCVTVENAEGSGRKPLNQMMLSKESLLGLMSSMVIHLNGEGIDFETVLKEMTDNGTIDYFLTPNLKPLNKTNDDAN